MKFFKYKNNNLFCEQVKVADLCKKHETPFYLYSYNSLINSYNNLSKLLSGSDTVIAYSVKANPNISILKSLAKCGSGADVVSVGELKRALNAGIPSTKIVYSGVGKKAKEISFALDAKIEQFNIESLDELKEISKIAEEKKTRAKIALRINPDVSAGGHPKISTGKKTDKFGIDINNAMEVYEIAKQLKSINIVGVDIHIGSQILKIAPFKRAFNKVIKFTKTLEKKGYNIKNIDLGGGIGINYLNDQDNLNFLKQYVRLVKSVYKKTQKKIFIEPGRYLIANAGILVTKVLYKKTTGNKLFLVVDAGMNDFLRPALYNAVHNIKPLLRNTKKTKRQKYEVVGPICESTDVLVKGALLDRNIRKGDFLFIDQVGAYGSSMASNYNSKDIASEIIVNDKKISLEDIISFEKTAPWL